MSVLFACARLPVRLACRLLDQIARQKELTDEEAKRLRGQLVAVEAEHKTLERRSGACLPARLPIGPRAGCCCCVLSSSVPNTRQAC